MKQLTPNEQRRVAGGTSEPKGYLVRKRQDSVSSLQAGWAASTTLHSWDSANGHVAQASQSILNDDVIDGFSKEYSAALWNGKHATCANSRAYE